jgi:hypothetical protein
MPWLAACSTVSRSRCCRSGVNTAPVASISDRGLYATRNMLPPGFVRLAYRVRPPLTIQTLTGKILGTNFAEWVNDEVRLASITT